MRPKRSPRLFILGLVVLCFGLLSVHPGLPVCVIGMALIWRNW